MVPLDQISPYMRAAVVATEDERFYQHSGVDPEGLMRATLETLQGNKQGASTLTQQYIKNVKIEAAIVAGDEEGIEAARESDGAEGIYRKLLEMKQAIELEKNYSKDQILEGYLNIAQFGANQIYGVEAASQYFFGSSAAEMTPAEAALIAGITKSPALYDPSKNGGDEDYTTATNRRDTVLWQMFNQGYITQEQYDEAIATPVAEMLNITPSPTGCAGAGISAYFCQYVTQKVIYDGYLSEDIDEARDMLRRGGYTIQTTIDPVKQQQAFDSLVAQIPIRDDSYTPKQGETGISGAISTVEPGTGNVLAMVQNTNYGEATDEDPRATRVNFNVDAKYGGGLGFQTGSTFKAFVLTQWLKNGGSLYDRINAADGQSFPANTWSISCSPSSVSLYEPKNLEPGGGTMTVLDATRGSVNTAYAFMANKMDLCDLRNTTSSMGVHVGAGQIRAADVAGTINEPLYSAQEGSDILAIPSMALGSNTIAPLTMAGAFATYAANGVFCEPRAITAITDRNGAAIEVQGPQCNQALDPEIAAGVTYALQQVVSTRGATGTAAALPGRPAAGKTGTANNDYHAWFIGYVPQLATAVWMGHSEGDIPMMYTRLNGRYYSQIYGGRIPAPIWGDYMAKALEGTEVIAFPDANERLIYGEQADVPYVVGRSINTARSILENNGWSVSVGEGRYSESVGEGAVAAQSATRTTRSSIITLYPSLGPDPALVTPEPTQDPAAPGGGGEGANADPGQGEDD